MTISCKGAPSEGAVMAKSSGRSSLPGRAPRRPRIFTVGHSTHALDAFVALLHTHQIGLLADVRAYPRSRRHPQFNEDSLAADLPSRGIAYRHYRELGGRRGAPPDSSNSGS